MKGARLIAGLFLLTVLTFFIASCSRQEQGYFPLTEGYRWSYAVTHTTKDAVSKQKYFLVNKGKMELNGKTVFVRQSLEGTELYYIEDEQGIVYVGNADMTGLNPVYTEDRHRVLAYPVTEETVWNEQTVTKLLQKTGPPQKTVFKIVADVPMQGRIVALDEIVNVPAGLFHHCIKVEMQGSSFKNAGNYVGLTLVNVKETSWYAPGVGLIKMERVEKTQSNVLDKGSLFIELMEFSRG